MPSIRTSGSVRFPGTTLSQSDHAAAAQMPARTSSTSDAERRAPRAQIAASSSGSGSGSGSGSAGGRRAGLAYG